MVSVIMKSIDLKTALDTVPDGTPMGIAFQDSCGEFQIVPLKSIIFDPRKPHIIFSACGKHEGLIMVDDPNDTKH